MLLSSQAWEYVYEKFVCRHPTPWFVGAAKNLTFLAYFYYTCPGAEPRFSIPGGFARDWADFAGLGNLARLHTLGVMFEAVGKRLFNIAMFADNYQSCLGAFIAHLTQGKYHNILYFNVSRFFAWYFLIISNFSKKLCALWSFSLCAVLVAVFVRYRNRSSQMTSENIFKHIRITLDILDHLEKAQKWFS